LSRQFLDSTGRPAGSRTSQAYAYYIYEALIEAGLLDAIKGETTELPPNVEINPLRYVYNSDNMWLNVSVRLDEGDVVAQIASKFLSAHDIQILPHLEAVLNHNGLSHYLMITDSNPRC